ncbi:MAG: Lpp/OprI family alanine-zipper lipoprotein [Gammaproteobacteria bacterium]
MKTRLESAMKVCGLALLAGIGAGCAAQGEGPTMSDVQQMAEQAAQDAQAARTAAEEAQSTASEAREMASGAQSTANEALSAANEAQACCDANSEKMDRMFERSQSK